MSRLKTKCPQRSPGVRLGVVSLEDRITPSNTFTGLGAASSYGVLVLNNGNMNLNNATVLGDVGVGNNASFVGNRFSTLDGTLFAGTQAHLQFGGTFAPTGGVELANMVDAVADARAASQSFGSQAPLHTFQTLNTSLTLDGNGGTSVYRVRGFDYRNDTLTLNGGANDVFVFNVTGDFSFRSSQMVLNGGVTANHVLFNFTSNNADVVVRNEDSVLFGTFLAPRGNVDYRGAASFQGAVVAREVAFLAGATLDNGVDEPPPTGGTASLSGMVYIDIDFSGHQNDEEGGVENVEMQLSGVDDLGNSVSLTTSTNGDGRYTFEGLRAGTYQVFEVQPEMHFDQFETVGTVNGVTSGELVANDTIGLIDLLDGGVGDGYNFGELFDSGN